MLIIVTIRVTAIVKALKPSCHSFFFFLNELIFADELSGKERMWGHRQEMMKARASAWLGM